MNALERISLWTTVSGQHMRLQALLTYHGFLLQHACPLDTFVPSQGHHLHVWERCLLGIAFYQTLIRLCASAPHEI